MDLDARPYRAFVTIADTGSFSRAAAMLHVSQPALSAQIREFERRLGFALFTRSSRRVALTTEGRLFLDRARRLVRETESANNAAREIRSNQLRIGVAHHTADIDARNRLIDDFMLAAPDVPLRVMRRSPAQIPDDLEAGDIDVGVLLDIADRAEPAGFRRWTIATRSLRLWVPDPHPLATAETIAAGAIAGIEIGAIDRSHGVPIAEGVINAVLQAGAVPMTLPEGDAQAVMRQCARLGRCAIDLGWFPASAPGMVSRAVDGWDGGTALIVLAGHGDRREGAARFLDRVAAVALR